MSKNITTTGNGGDLIPGTNWTYAAAASMAKEVSREHRLFGNRSNRRRRAKRNDVGLMVTNPSRFTELTGWTPEDALEMALEHRRDERIFGRDLGQGIGEDEIETHDGNSLGDGFYIIAEDGTFDKEAMRERRLFGSNLWN